jgi:hypothetical protein
MRNKIRSWLGSEGGTLTAATLLLLSAALYNGYPLVYSDTGTYLSSGFEGKVPADRPLAYGLFLRHCSLWFSLWLPVLLQCAALAWAMRLLWRTVLPEERGALPFLGTCALLCAGTALPWYSGQLMPDVCTPLQALLIAVLLLRPQLARWQWILAGFLYVFCSIAHFSNLFIALVALLGAFKLRWLFPEIFPLPWPAFRRRMGILLLWSALAFVAQPTLHWAYGGGFSLGKGGATFLIGRLIDNGVLKQYLDKTCPEKGYRLCQYKDSLPANSRLFHWDESSPLYKEGGWGVPEAEYRSIVAGTLASPRFLALHLWESALATPVQLLQNAVGSGLDYKWYRSPESPPYQAVARYFPHELNEYRFSRQCGNLWKQELNFDFFNALQFVLLLASALLLPLLLARHRQRPFLNAQSTAMLALLLCGIVANAFVTASLASICDRFPSRVAWLLPFAAALLLWQWAKHRNSTPN